MEEQELQRLTPAQAIKLGEGQQIEWMRDFPDNTWELRKEIAAFATSNPGVIFLGIDDDGSIRGMDGLQQVTGKDRMKRRIDGVARGVKPSVTVRTSFPIDEESGVTLVRIGVPSCPEPVYYVGDVLYLRSGQESRPANPDEVKELHRQYFEQTGLLSVGAQEGFDRFKAQELAEITKLDLGEGVSWLAFIACPRGPARAFLDRLDLDRPEFQEELRKMLVDTRLPDGSTVWGQIRFIPEEECIRLVWGGDEKQPICMLKLDVHLCGSWGTILGGERPTLDLDAVDWWSTWFATVLGKIYAAYDKGDEIAEVSIGMFLKNFKQKLLEAGGRNRYKYRGDEDPCLFPKGKPLLRSKPELLKNPAGITQELVSLFRRSYTRQID